MSWMKRTLRGRSCPRLTITLEILLLPCRTTVLPLFLFIKLFVGEDCLRVGYVSQGQKSDSRYPYAQPSWRPGRVGRPARLCRVVDLPKDFESVELVINCTIKATFLYGGRECIYICTLSPTTQKKVALTAPPTTSSTLSKSFGRSTTALLVDPLYLVFNLVAHTKACH